MENLAFQDHLLARAGAGATVVTETARLAHALSRRHRAARLAEGASGWEPLRVVTLNDWLKASWESRWPASFPAQPYERLAALRRACAALPPPEPLWAAPEFLSALDGSFEALLRYGFDPGAGGSGGALIEWRRAVWPLVCEELSRRGLFHPGDLARRVFEALAEDDRPEGGPVAVAGFEFAGAWERRLLERLLQAPGSAHLPLPEGGGRGGVCARVFSDPEQELWALCEEVAAAASDHPLHELAVAVLDPGGFGSLLERAFRDLFGDPAGPEGGFAWNPLPRVTLAEQPLYCAAVLPLAVAGGGCRRGDLFALLSSPFYKALSAHGRALAGADRLWREEGVEGGLSALFPALWRVAPEGAAGALETLERGLRELLAMGSAPGSRWIAALRALWAALGFAASPGDVGAVSADALEKMLSRFEAACGGDSFSAPELLSWLFVGARQATASPTGREEAGIQVLGRLEVRGLAFEHLWVPGLCAGALPEPERPLPFLSGEERARVQGGTAESQHAFGKFLFGRFQAAGRVLHVSRPVLDAAGGMRLPSPFFPEEPKAPEPPVVPWRGPLPAAARAGWVTAARRGLARYPETLREPPPRAPVPLPPEVSVSAVGRLMECPALYLFEYLLRLRPLEEIERGLPPKERGVRIHRVLERVGRAVKAACDAGACTLENISGTLERAVAEEFPGAGAPPHLRAEARRLLAPREGEWGLLRLWLDAEWKRIGKGWRWVAFETPFRNLVIPGAPVTVRGKLDRVDAHPEAGLCCWDYKTGRPTPGRKVLEEMSQPQLPLYLLAVRGGAVGGGGALGGSPLGAEPLGGGELSAGYVELRSAKALKVREVIRPGSGGLLDSWEARVAGALSAAASGDFTPRFARPEKCPKECSHAPLCGAFYSALASEEDMSPAEEDSI